ncbi:amino acid deaminase [uncultured Microbacterium sp.]|uniref:amino acid deaminase n=1 Tax=uncultured Microbacterium sp. TaxID=191216 RepID=UPI0028DBFACB|nr:amino acid deaminase [uncultured Microbacterium sp.]
MSTLDDLTRAARRAETGRAADARAALDALPWLDASLADDRASGRFARWGRSTVVDENTGAAVITRALFDELHERAGIDAAWPVGNAGLLHCYGYLLSLAETRYGLKRDRWLDGSLAAQLGRVADAFHPWRDGPTLLARASEAASALLFGPAASATATTVTAVIDGRETRATLTAASGPAALAYAVAPHPGAAPLLVTMFPVAEASAPLAEFTAVPRLRWNAA